MLRAEHDRQRPCFVTYALGRTDAVRTEEDDIDVLCGQGSCCIRVYLDLELLVRRAELRLEAGVDGGGEGSAFEERSGFEHP